MAEAPARRPVVLDNAKLLVQIQAVVAHRRISLRKAMAEAGVSQNVPSRLREPGYVPDANTFAAIMYWGNFPLATVVTLKPEEVDDGAPALASGI